MKSTGSIVSFKVTVNKCFCFFRITVAWTPSCFACIELDGDTAGLRFRSRVVVAVVLKHPYPETKADVVQRFVPPKDRRTLIR